jgi:hypothetical protein
VEILLGDFNTKQGEKILVFSSQQPGMRDYVKLLMIMELE